MIRLSELLTKMGYDDFEMINEKEFKFLSLSSTSLDVESCTFVDDEKVIKNISKNTRMVLTNKNLIDKFVDQPYGICIIDNPRIVFFESHNYLSETEGYKRVSRNTTFGKNCKISHLASIAGENVVIGDNVVVEEFAVIRENTTICSGSVVRAGTVVGGQGFEFKRDKERVLSVKHVGGVHIGENVEIQYNTTIDCGVYPWDDTTIGDSCKVDNLVYIAHGVKLGEGVMIAGQSGIFGRSCIEKNTWIGAGAVVSNGIKIGANARVNIGAVVTRDVEEGSSVTGNFAIDHKKFLKHLKEVSTTHIER